MAIIYFLYFYLAAGFLFALYFIFFRLPHIDANAKQTSVGFKLLILPGCILLWPLLITKKEIKH
jgi:hypothetical protein